MHILFLLKMTMLLHAFSFCCFYLRVIIPSNLLYFPILAQAHLFSFQSLSLLFLILSHNFLSLLLSFSHYLFLSRVLASFPPNPVILFYHKLTIAIPRQALIVLYVISHDDTHVMLVLALNLLALLAEAIGWVILFNPVLGSDLLLPLSDEPGVAASVFKHYLSLYCPSHKYY